MGRPEPRTVRAPRARASGADRADPPAPRALREGPPRAPLESLPEPRRPLTHVALGISALGVALLALAWILRALGFDSTEP